MAHRHRCTGSSNQRSAGGDACSGGGPTGTRFGEFSDVRWNRAFIRRNTLYYSSRFLPGRTMKTILKRLCLVSCFFCFVLLQTPWCSEVGQRRYLRAFECRAFCSTLFSFSIRGKQALPPRIHHVEIMGESVFVLSPSPRWRVSPSASGDREDLCALGHFCRLL